VTTRSLCDEIAADAAAWEAMPADAPERVRAEAHAATCPTCARALAEGRRLLELLDAAALPAPSAAALRNASASILAELDAATPARAGAGRLAGAVAATVVAMWAVPLALSRRPIAGGRELAASLGLALLAAVASAATITLGGAVAVAFPVISAAASLLAGSGYELAAGPGLHCALIEGLVAAGAGLATWGVARALGRRALDAPVWVAALGGGALAGHAALHETCAAATQVPHTLVFHTGPVLLAVALAFAVTKNTLRAPQT